MVRKKKGSEKWSSEPLPKLTEIEPDLLWHMGLGYRLETGSLGGDSVLRNQDDEVLRPASAHRNTLKALQEPGLIRQVKSRDPLKISWQIRKQATGK